MGIYQNGGTLSYVCLFWWAHPTTLQWCASAKGYPCLGEKTLVNTQTGEVWVIFVAIWKWSACLIIYPVIPMQIQTPSHRHLHLKFLARVYSVPDYLPMHGTRISLWHRRAFLWVAVDFNSRAEQKNRWSMWRRHTSGTVDSSCCLGPWSSKKETEVRNICTQRSTCKIRQDEILMVELD